MNIPYDKILKIIADKSNLSQDEIEGKIKEKLDQLPGLLTKEGAAHIIANELNVNVIESFTGKYKVSELVKGLKGIEIIGKVLQVYEVREFQVRSRSGKVGSFTIGDQTGRIRIVAWGDNSNIIKDLKVNDIVKVESAYTRNNNEQLEVHLNDNSKITINPEGVEVKEVNTNGKKRFKVSELKENSGRVELLGTIVQLFEPRFYQTCPECNKKVKDSKCEVHGDVEATTGYIANFVLDDSSETIRVVCFRNLVLDLFSMDNTKILSLQDNVKEFEDVKENLLGNFIKIQGRVRKNSMFDRLEIIADNVEVNPSPKKEIDRLNEMENPS